MKVSTEIDNNFGYEKITTCGSWAKEKLSTRGRKRTSEIKRNRSEVFSKWNKCRIYVGDQLPLDGANSRKCLIIVDR
jgi:hypothetical protein